MRDRKLWIGIIIVLIVLIGLAGMALIVPRLGEQDWSASERATLQSLWIGSLGPVPPDPSNRVADDPRAAAFGRQLFFDTRFSANGQVACATCHQPERYFTDGRPFAVGVGQLPLNTITLIGASYSPWQTWNGKADSQWSQALIPLENPVEHGGDRVHYAHLLARHYRNEYEALFGPLPPLEEVARFPAHAAPSQNEMLQAAWDAMAPEDQEAVNQVFANMGKALAAYERTLLPSASRFDDYVEAVLGGKRAAAATLLSADEIAGLRLFIGKGRCINCHNGPLFTNYEFHNTAIPGAPGVPLERGRIAGVELLQNDPFNCLGVYSDAAPEQCTGLRFLVTEGTTLEGGFKTATLRNIAATAPYMHTGQFQSLRQVIEHYDAGGLALIGHSELTPLGLSDVERRYLESFLGTLTGSAPTE